MSTYGAAPLRILLDETTRIAAIDGQLAAELGHDTADLLDAPFSTILAPDEVAAVGADLVALVEDRHAVSTATRRLRAADGSELGAVISAEARHAGTRFVGFTVAVLLDDDELSIPTALPDHLRRLETAAAMIDADATLVDTNLAWGRLFATADAVTPGGDLYALVQEDDRDGLRHRLSELARAVVGSVRVELRCIAESGPFWCRLSLARYDTRSRYFTVTAEDISVERLTQRVLLANEALFRSLAEAAPIGLARLAPDLSISYASPAWLNLVGWPEGDTPRTLGALLHPDDRSRVETDIRARIAAGTAEPVPARLAQPAGSGWVSLRVGSVLDDELGVIGHVITVQEDADREAPDHSRSQLAGILESTSDLVGIADLTDGRVLYLNAAAQAIFAPDGLGELHVRDVYDDESVGRYRAEVYPVLRRGETWTGELGMVGHDGRHLQVLQTVAAEIGPDGEPHRASVLGRDVSDERAALDELAYKATHDALTGLPNRSLLVDHLELALARSARERTPVAVLFIDLDRFKEVNDTYGHDAGDRLLRELGQRMAAVLRPSDTVARLGGDEFVVLCEDIGGEVDAVAIAERIRGAVEEQPVRIDGVQVRVSASIGIAMSNGGSTREPDTLLKRADIAMYRAKSAGRARTELFDDVRRDRTKRRAERAEQLAEALEEDALDVHYQPIVDLHSGRVVRVEAFVRWMHPVGGLLGPSEFVPLAVETGLGLDLDSLVIHRACTDARRWHTALGDASPVVHVNILGGTLLSGRLHDRVARCLEVTDLPAAKLCMELAEPFLMDDGDATVDLLARLAELGVGVAIDDVGTGGTVLPRLGRFRLDVLKIDGSLAGAVVAEETRQIVGAVAAMGRALDMQVGAESVEDAEAIPILRKLGVHVAQGHVFSAALPAAKLDPLLTLRSTLARSDR